MIFIWKGDVSVNVTAINELTSRKRVMLKWNGGKEKIKVHLLYQVISEMIDIISYF